MGNPIAVIGALATLGSSLADFASKFRKDDFALKVSEWNKELLQAQTLISELISKNTALELENQKLKEHKSTPLQWRNALYWDEGDDVPFCPVCYEGKKDRFHLTPYSPTNGAIAYTCGHCDKHFIPC